MPFFKHKHSCYMVVSPCFRLMTVIIAIMSSIICWITGTQKFFHILNAVETLHLASSLCTLQVLFAPCKFSLHLASSLCTLQVLFVPCMFSLHLASSLCTLQVLFAPCKFSLLPYVKDPLKGRRCESTDTISSAVMVSIH